MRITAERFLAATGNPPQRDDLDRCNCLDAGNFGHALCGWDRQANLPVFMTGERTDHDHRDELAYARLSFEVGLFAGRADAHLKSDRFLTLTIANAWTLTPALLEDWRAIAKALGVPDEVLRA